MLHLHNAFEISEQFLRYYYMVISIYELLEENESFVHI